MTNLEGKFKTAYCHQCDEDVDIAVKEEYQDNIIKGIKVTTLVDHAYCVHCGTEVYIPELNDANLDKIDTKFREDTHRIKIAEIEALLEKYQIGAKPLSLMLNWGECTIQRYLKGQIPNKGHSVTLKSLENPHTFYEIFQQNKEVLTGVAKNKVEKSLNNFIDLDLKEENSIAEKSLLDYFSAKDLSIFNGYTNFHLNKLINGILFFSNRLSGVYKTKMNKLLWYSDMLQFKHKKNTIFGLRYIHDFHGPVPERFDWIFGALSDIYIELEETDYGTKIKPLKPVNKNCFNEDELKVLEKICDKFGLWWAGDLSKYAHEEKAYEQTNFRDFIPFSFADELRIQ